MCGRRPWTFRCWDSWVLGPSRFTSCRCQFEFSFRQVSGVKSGSFRGVVWRSQKWSPAPRNTPYLRSQVHQCWWAFRRWCRWPFAWTPPRTGASELFDHSFSWGEHPENSSKNAVFEVTAWQCSIQIRNGMCKVLVDVWICFYGLLQGESTLIFWWPCWHPWICQSISCLSLTWSLAPLHCGFCHHCPTISWPVIHFQRSWNTGFIRTISSWNTWTIPAGSDGFINWGLTSSRYRSSSIKGRIIGPYGCTKTQTG